MQLQGQSGGHVLVGVGGGIAAYKTCELVRLLIKDGLEVQVALTGAAAQFVTALTFQSLSGREVYADVFAAERADIAHITLAAEARAMIIAPATADLIGRIAGGLAADPVSLLCLALPAEVPVILAPAMNTRMWENPLVQGNLDRLRGLRRPGAGAKYRVIDPVTGFLACRTEGLGAMADPAAIHAALREVLQEASGRPEQ